MTNKDDPHQVYSDAVVQHITFEDFELFNKNNKASSAIGQAIHELMMKADLINNKITLFNWADMGLDCRISFGIKAEKMNSHIISLWK